jgi:hypothetical protein
MDTNDVLSNYNKFLTDHYSQLVGATIDAFRFEQDNFDAYIQWPVFDVTLADGTKTSIYIQADEEGNGAGFISGIPMV